MELRCGSLAVRMYVTHDSRSAVWVYCISTHAPWTDAKGSLCCLVEVVHLGGSLVVGECTLYTGCCCCCSTTYTSVHKPARSFVASLLSQQQPHLNVLIQPPLPPTSISSIATYSTQHLTSSCHRGMALSDAANRAETIGIAPRTAASLHLTASAPALAAAASHVFRKQHSVDPALHRLQPVYPLLPCVPLNSSSSLRSIAPSFRVPVSSLSPLPLALDSSTVAECVWLVGCPLSRSCAAAPSFVGRAP